MTNDEPSAAERATWMATRRTVVRRAAGASAVLALPFAGLVGARVVGAKDEGADDHDHGDGHGRGRGRGGDDAGAPPAAGAAAGAAAPAGPGEVTIVGRTFQPATITIAPGQTVTWRNASDDEHTASGAGFDTGVIPAGGSAIATFDAAGSFPYQCNFHPEMQGTVIVADATGATTGGPQTASSGDAGTDGLAGVWRAKFDAPGFGAYEGLATFHADGALATAYVPTGDTNAASPPLGPGQGVWESDADGGYRLTAVSLLLDDNGRFAGTLTIHETGRLDPNGDAYAGSFQGDIVGANGGARAVGPGTTTGQRIRIEAVPSAAAPSVAAPAATPAVAATAATAPPAAAAVAIHDFAFDPATLEIVVGATVTWRNDGAAPHTATATGGAFDTGRIDPGQQATATFDQPGSFAYRCAFPPNMQGTIVVR
ncbi:MAG TPA: cupredoxin domain-containing protein [Thermomicrobiales bacterium]|nr:cupredoxin domain-containing protein [Thermomicrobiales bacterium]